MKITLVAPARASPKDGWFGTCCFLPVKGDAKPGFSPDVLGVSCV